MKGCECFGTYKMGFSYVINSKIEIDTCIDIASLHVFVKLY